MAGEYLRSHGIDIDAEMSRIQFGDYPTSTRTPQDRTTQITTILNASLPSKPAGSTWNIHLSASHISSITPSSSSPTQPTPPSPSTLQANTALLAPSLCHPHIHLDKAYLLSHPSHSHLKPKSGTFSEAMELTNTAKSNFTETDLLERGRRVIEESLAAGVTHMRAFVEVDSVVGTKCLDAGLMLKREFEGRCVVQVCAFAQLPLWTRVEGDREGEVIRGLMREAGGREGVDVLGSTPYVEGDRERMVRNVECMVELAIEMGVHLDFHLDYNLDGGTEALVWDVVRLLKEKRWNARTSKTVVLGHCTRLTMISKEEWTKLRNEIGDLKISFVGLPTSDLFMMRTAEKVRGTLHVLELIKEHGLNACLGINNIGNAFTPQGSCDPLTLACNGVGIYQAGTGEDADLLYQCVSTRARAAIGLDSGAKELGCEVREGNAANLVLFAAEQVAWHTRQDIQEVVQLYDHARNRRTLIEGMLVDA